MAVYVANMFRTQPTVAWPFKSACHMVADTPAELHQMAGRLRIPSKGFRVDGDVPRYNLVASKRTRAVELGAVEVAPDDVWGLFARIREATVLRRSGEHKEQKR